MKKYVRWLLVILVVGLVLTYIRWNDFREKELVKVLEAEEIKEFRFADGTEKYPGIEFNGKVKDSESLRELIDFLSQYKVKKVQNNIFTSNYPKEQFNFMLEYEDERSTVPSTIERDVVLFDMNQYSVTNGPIDYEWIEKFIAKQEY